ncbi:MAG: hypothetical protein AAGA30_18055 [Planctomycetota bacterium]
MWISEAIGKGYIQPSRAKRHSGGKEAATQWLRTNYKHIPEELRPHQHDISEFAAFFSTFLTSSFDVVEKPGTKGEGPTPTICQCELCMRIINAPHLRTKKLYARDKRRAVMLMQQCLINFATRNGFELTEELAEQLLLNPTTKRSAAYVTYGHWLISRLSGISDGPAILALWRLIAWDPRGGMRRDFILKLDDFKTAESSLLSVVKDWIA